MHLRFSLTADGKPRSAAAIVPPILAVVFALWSWELISNDTNASYSECNRECEQLQRSMQQGSCSASSVGCRFWVVLTALHLAVGSEALIDTVGAVLKSRNVSNRLLLPPVAKKRCTGSRRSSTIYLSSFQR